MIARATCARRLGYGVVVLTAFACGSRGPDRALAHAALGGEIVARVGDVDIPVGLVASVARARHITADAALALLVDDAVASKAAVAQGKDRSVELDFAVTSAKARATVDHLNAAAHATPPSDDEISALTKLHWLTVDAPEALVAVHAVARRAPPEKPDAHVDTAAKAVAAAILAAVGPATDGDDFQTRAKAVPHAGVEVVVQALDPFSADGRVMVEGGAGEYDKAFAAAAAALPAGATSGVVESSFGWHVIRMVERRPARSVPLDERRRMFTEEVYARRGQDAVARVTGGKPWSVANGVDDLLAEALPIIRGQEPAAADPR
jgi:hypothetical protein